MSAAPPLAARDAPAALATTLRKIRWGFGLALGCLALVGLVSYLAVARLNDNAVNVEHGHEVLSSLELLLAAVTDSETAERGYVITGDESYLEPYQRAAAVVNGEARRLRGLTAGNPAELERVAAIEALVSDRLATLRIVIELRREQGFAAAQAEILTGKGKRFHDRIRHLIADMEATEGARLAQSERRTRLSSLLARTVIIGGGLLALGITGLALLAIRRDFAGRARAERELREAKDELERRVEQRTAQLALSEARMRAVFDAAMDGIVTLDADGRITDFNPAAEEIFGHRRSGALGLPLTELIAPGASGDVPLPPGAEGMTHRRLEVTGVRNDGSEVMLEISLRRMPGTGPASFAGFVRDLTERERALEMNARLASIIESSVDAIASKDLNGIITSWNEGAERLFGYPASEAIGRPMAMLIPQERASEEPAILARIARGQRTDHFETVRTAKSGRPIDVSVTVSPIRDGQGRIIGASSIARDITERKLAQSRVQAHLERLKLLEVITRAIGERQDIRSIFQAVVRALEENLPLDFCCIGLYERAEQCLIVSSIGAHSDALALELAMAQQGRLQIDGSGLSPCLEGRLVYEPDTRRISLPFPQRLAARSLHALVAAPLLLESALFGVLIAARRQEDSFSGGECEFLGQVSEHVALAAHHAQLYAALQRAYDDLRETQRAMMQQERLLALGQMASGIAHDINNAISPVALYTESLLEREPGLSLRARGYLETIQRAIEDVGQTVARMREFYRQREPQMLRKPLDANALIRQVVALTRVRWSDLAQQRGIVIDMRTELAADLPPILGADHEIRDALTNLIFNAIDAMPGGGPLLVRSSIEHVPGLGEREPTRRYIRLEVTDAGIGMDEETRRRCLEPFFTTKGERGTGLGLAMVYGAMQRHGADIEIDSAPGQGTTVRLRFAVADEDSTPPHAAANPPAAPQPPLRVLLVDDDPLVLKSLRDALAADGHEVTIADGGRPGIEAFEAACSEGRPFAAVITDLGMPHVDGRQVASTVKGTAPGTLVLLLTGWGQRLMADGELPAHVDRVLSKPPRLNELREALAQCVRERV